MIDIAGLLVDRDVRRGELPSTEKDAYMLSDTELVRLAVKALDGCGCCALYNDESPEVHLLVSELLARLGGRDA